MEGTMEGKGARKESFIAPLPSKVPSMLFDETLYFEVKFYIP